MLEGLVLFFKIMLINMILSGDNALVIAMASKNLPIQQRKTAILLGSLGAIVLRIALLAIAVFLLQIPYIQAIGSLMLMYIAMKLLSDNVENTSVRPSSYLFAAVWTIMMADLFMSLDNVLAIAAVAKGDLALMIMGIALSIPLILWGSTMIMKLLERFTILIYLGAAILGFTAGEMLLNDQIVGTMLLSQHASFHWLIPVAAMLIVVMSGIMRKPYA